MTENVGALPKMTISITSQERRRVEALARALGVRPSRAFGISVQHTLIALRKGEPLHLDVGELGEERPEEGK